MNFKNPILNNFKYIYNEYDEGQYICLDTNGHIIHALLNIYEKI
jgi:AAA+ ATPase superfamily predicted ATPase